MALVILLDSGPLGRAAQARGKLKADQCHLWLAARVASGAAIIVPEIADYEVRRELRRVGATAGLRRLDGLRRQFTYRPITSAAIRRAARLWATLRNTGYVTAPPQALDGDAILAAQAVNEQRNRPGDQVVVATENLAHLAWFPRIDAREWWTIA